MVESDTFYNSTEIKEIQLQSSIYNLGKGVFSNMRQLKRLEQIDVDLFSNLRLIVEIVFSANGLKELPAAVVENSRIRDLKPLQVLQNSHKIYLFFIGRLMMYPSAEFNNLTKILPLKGLYCYQTCLFVKSTICDRNYSTIDFNYVTHEHDTCLQNIFNYETSRINFVEIK